MDKDKSRRRMGPPGAKVTGALALLLVVCLAECATEQRINSRGSKSSNIIEKVNGWRSQRGGSCLSYGHSCWGAHGKRSGKPPVTAPDWFLAKLFRRMDTAELNHARQAAKNDDINAVYQVDAPDDSLPTDRLGSDNEILPLDLTLNRNPEAKPMLDDDLLSKIKLLQIMREVSEEK
ncbi:neuropeptide CCHamide-1 isoform X1 [Pectinophora gossypiella]|uniref:neuropeptide CCHamide-1 isoform X1 n=1 Tax=Pectinophora gossypiella TaxID=13191 RepID=UPI00214EAF75|nr:neuropeptide CCHamide-1 isoform X1 [Pectinophora gossypiella]XP_049870855.1 neuropeptide CCHamide-1 isoform X1 [Pectinophora gossypiella]